MTMSGCTISIADQLVELARLEPGWLDGDGAAISSLTLLAASSEIAKRVPADIVPFLYPTAEGGISVEWDVAGQEHGFDIEPIAPLLTAVQGVALRAELARDDDD